MQNLDLFPMALQVQTEENEEDAVPHQHHGAQPEDHGGSCDHEHCDLPLHSDGSLHASRDPEHRRGQSL